MARTRPDDPAPGAAFEEWIATYLPQLCRALDIETDGMRFESRVPKPGAVVGQEVDILGTADDRLLLVECKDHRRLKNSEIVSTLYRFISIAQANPNLVVHGLLVSASALSNPATRIYEDLGRVFSRPPNLADHLDLISVGPRLIEGHVLIRRYRHGANEVIAVGSNPRRQSLETLEYIITTGDTLEGRLRASLEVVSMHRDTSLRPLALHEGATCLLHLRESVGAHDLAVAALRTPRFTRDESLQDAGLLIVAMSQFQQGLERHSRRYRPGAGVVRRLEARLNQVTERERISYLQFLGAWHGQYGSLKCARRYLLDSARIVESAAAPDSRYLAFLASFRMAEIARPEERDRLLAEADVHIPDLGPRHSSLARELSRRMRAGDETSIASGVFKRVVMGPNHQ